MKKLIFEQLRKRKERFPSLLTIEFSSICNAKCIMCPQPEMDRKKENMSFADYEEHMKGVGLNDVA